jgi:hypothetical protein
VEESMHVKFDDKQPDSMSELVEKLEDTHISEDEDSEEEIMSEVLQNPDI